MTAPQLVKPAYLHVPEWVRTDGDEVAGLCDDASYGPDPEQRMLLDAVFGKDEHGKSAAFETWVVACRQNLKTGLMKMAVLGWAFLYKADPIMWTAHQWDPAVKEAFTDLEELIGGYRWLAQRVRYVHTGDRQQEIGLRNGSRIMFKTRTNATGRALAGEKVILDEGWALHAGHMGALLPTMSARSMLGDPQVLGGSSAAHANSDVLHGVLDRGRAAAGSAAAARLERKLCYAEYRAPGPEIACRQGVKCRHALDTPGCGCDKPEYIAMANPAVGRRISMEYILVSERRGMPPAEYGRERMGWEDTPEGLAVVIPLTDWADGLDPGSEPAGPVALSVVYTSDKREAVIGLAGRRGDRSWHVEVADVVPVSDVVTRVGEIIAKAAGTSRQVCAVVVDPHGFEGACIKGLEDLREVKLRDASPDDEEVGIDPVLVRILPARSDDLAWVSGRPPVLVRPTATDVAAAYTGFLTAVTATHDLFHRGQDELTLALVGATSRDVGDAGQAWGRRKSGVEIAPLVAVTEARWVHEQKAPLEESEPGAWQL
jgi:hypothetical protein